MSPEKKETVPTTHTPKKKGPQKGSTVKRISNQDFVRVWMSKETLNEIVQELGISINSVVTKRNKMLKLKINLPDRKGISTHKKLKDQVGELNALISDLSTQ